MNTTEFDKAAKLLSCIKDRAIAQKVVTELDQYAGGSVQDQANRKTYEELSEATKVIVDIATRG